MATDDSLPDTFEEFINGGDSAELLYAEDDGDQDIASMYDVSDIDLGAADQLYQTITEQSVDDRHTSINDYDVDDPMRTVGTDAVVLDYSVIYALAQREEFNDGDQEAKWRDVITLSQRAHSLDDPIPVLVPGDARGRLEKRYDETYVDDVISPLEEMTFTLDTGKDAVQLANRDYPEANMNLARSADDMVPGDVTIATYNKVYNGTEMHPGLLRRFDSVSAANPRTLLRTVALDEGTYDHSQVNRVSNLHRYIDWSDCATFQEKGGVPQPYQNVDIDTFPSIDTLVLDHGVVQDALMERYRGDEDGLYAGTSLFGLLDDVATYNDEDADIDVRTLDDQVEKLAPLMKDTHARTVTAELFTVADALPINTFAVPDRFEDMAEDYHIARAALDTVDPATDTMPLVVTADGDFAELPGLALDVRRARTVLEDQYGENGSDH